MPVTRRTVTCWCCVCANGKGAIIQVLHVPSWQIGHAPVWPMHTRCEGGSVGRERFDDQSSLPGSHSRWLVRAQQQRRCMIATLKEQVGGAACSKMADTSIYSS
eukprot:scaffold1132_cov347-Pavlova_lutheri.AAC.2